MPVPDDRWSLVERLFFEALEQSPVDVEAFLASTTTDASVQADVRSLLDNVPQRARLIETAIGRAARNWDSERAAAPLTLIGRRLGAYEITAVAGQGGMGAVYRARRADGQFEQAVAIKLVRHGYDTPAALDRFRQERQILARLNHPGVARLLDGGSAQDEGGREVPYLVMEFVEGQPLTTYCESATLSLPGRLALFQRVCAVVQHAHQELIVHRDLKPANILVTADGQVKLLDFGIAKLLTDEGPALTQVGAAMLTPAYASPEQVSGAPITVATDVYALGLILYEILVGRQAQHVTGDSAVELAQVVCETMPLRPSEALRFRRAERAEASNVDQPRATGYQGRSRWLARPEASALSRQLEGDLDTIVLKALQKDPARRYRSVEQFSDDLARYLEARPVLARPDTFRYRTGKFLRRHAVATSAAAIVAITLVAALIVTRNEARARAAEAARAERRFSQVRTLANTFLFEFHDAIDDLPGSTKARALVVTTASEYLKSLASDAAGDASLQEELVSAYERLGNLQGGVSFDNLGRSQAAQESFQKALTLAESLLKGGARGKDLRLMTSRLHLRLAEISTEKGVSSEATAHLEQAITIADELRRDDPADDANRYMLLSAYNRLGDERLRSGDATSAEASFKQAVAISREVLAHGQSPDRARSALVNTLARLAGALRENGRLDAAVTAFRECVTMTLAHLDQAAPSTQRLSMLLYTDLGKTLAGEGRPSLLQLSQAVEYFEKARAMAVKLEAADPNNAEARVDGIDVDIEYAAAIASSDPRAAAVLHADMASRLDRLIANDPDRPRLRMLKARGDSLHGAALIRLGRFREARTLLEQAARVQEQAGEAEAEELVRTIRSTGDVDVEDRRFADAASRYRDALKMAEGLVRKSPTRWSARVLVAESQERLAALAGRQRDCATANTLYEQSRTEWQEWIRTGRATVWAQSRLQAVDAAVRTCNFP